MENPATWNVLTAVLSRCDLDASPAVWVVLRHARLVTEGGRPTLDAACAALAARPPGLVGRSAASEIADAIRRAGFATPRALAADPRGDKAAALLRRAMRR